MKNILCKIAYFSIPVFAVGLGIFFTLLNYYLSSKGI